MHIYADILENPLFITIALIVVFGIIVVGVMLLKKYVKFFQNDEGPKSDKEIAEEEVNRVLTDITDEETLKEMEMAAKKMERVSEEKGRPTDAEILEEEIARATEDVVDEETARQMAKYAEEHPEESEFFNKENSEEK